MGLINLKTNLKSLQFGNDTQGGGSSGLPYIKTGLPEDSPAGEYLAGIARNSADWPLRGGVYSTVAATTDTVRISRFLTDFPKGSMFTAKQVGLQKSNPKIETGGKASRLNTQTYNLNANLLAQILLEGDGTHLPRPGANTNELGPEGQKNKYEYIVSHKGTDQNRLVTLYSLKVKTPDNISLGPIISNADKLGINSDNDNILFDYPGGPDSLYGDGNTTIFKATDSQGVPINTYNAPKGQIRPLPVINITNFISNKFNTILKSDVAPSNPTANILLYSNTEYQQSSPDYIRPDSIPSDLPPINYFGNTLSYRSLLESKGDDLTISELQDFRSKTIDPNSPSAKLASTVTYTKGGPNGTGFRMESRIGIGSPGKRPERLRTSFYDEFKEGQDLINMSPIYKRADSYPVEDDSEDVRDLIKFCIESIVVDKPNETNRMHFRAFITNFSDNIGADWNGQKYMGRGENFYTYQGFTREVGFTFIVAAQSVEEMEKIYQKVNYLASTLHPDYQTGTSFMRGTLHKLTIGEYFYRTPGIITSMNISVDDNYPWEIKMEQPELRKKNNGDINASGDQLQMEVPQILKIQMNFKPILNNLPQSGINIPIITSNKIANSYLSRPNLDFSRPFPKPPSSTVPNDPELPPSVQ